MNYNTKDLELRIKRYWELIYLRAVDKYYESRFNRFTPYSKSSRKELLGLLYQLIELDRSYFDSNYNSLIKILEKDFIIFKNRYTVKFYSKLTELVSNFKYYPVPSVKKIDTGGPYNFSILFPKLWSYLKEYVPLRHPEYLTIQIPDPKVNLVAFSAVEMVSYHSPTQPMACVPYEALWINIFLNKFVPYQALVPRFDLNKCIKYIEFYPKYASLIIHEYEHILQNANKQKDKLPLDIGVRESELRKNILKSLDKGSPFYFLFYPILNTLYEKSNVFAKMMYTHRRGEYDLNPTEIEARLSQYIYLRLGGYSQNDILNHDLFRFTASMNKFKRDVTYLENKRDLLLKENDSVEIKKINYELYDLNELIKLYSFLFSEVENIANRLIEKRNELEKIQDA